MSINSLKETVSDDELQTVKASLRLEPDMTDDDKLVKMLIKAARRDVISQVGERINDFFDNNEVFNAAVILEVSHLYNHRSATSEQQTYEVPMALYSLINSMKDEYRYRIMKSDGLLSDDSSDSADAESSNEKTANSNQTSELGDEHNG
ncbi:phage gp6-like head-tail connector protein [Limosilactobacillus sp. STM2_1]|uniref:Phage gp6-like head-tail connector protein n=1 Tax=Limosilactobacillus rudii TaxID=2759755 RepID=A0A7W3UK41_9LACO|nr:head-tail connector protein [Limosilactobacillus rudii]MBB1079064.1 phage gp6-like head-tail connector protein [Limosilactobacillus rudii]MBB1097061.1 phage gp6-like head-tail connector protein [Limosilactobacillus rudii]MCD7134029.1 head-tail connector protein [Limosilactobacillus rudii]